MRTSARNEVKRRRAGATGRQGGLGERASIDSTVERRKRYSAEPAGMLKEQLVALSLELDDKRKIEELLRRKIATEKASLPHVEQEVQAKFQSIVQVSPPLRVLAQDEDCALKLCDALLLGCGKPG